MQVSHFFLYNVYFGAGEIRFLCAIVCVNTAKIKRLCHNYVVTFWLCVIIQSSQMESRYVREIIKIK